MIIKFDKICQKMMLYQSNCDGWWMLNLTLGCITIGGILFTLSHTDCNSLENLPAVSESPATNKIREAIVSPPEQWIQQMWMLLYHIYVNSSCGSSIFRVFLIKIGEAGAHVEGVPHMTVFPDNSNKSVKKHHFVIFSYLILTMK